MNKNRFFSSYWIHLSLGLVFLSLLLHGLHLLIFRDGHHLAIYLLGDIAFVPFEVLLVSVILHRLLEHRAKRDRIRKLNMVIGAFFTETGNTLLSEFAARDAGREAMGNTLRISSGWTSAEWKIASESISKIGEGPVFGFSDAGILRKDLIEQRPFLLSLLQNPTLLEHQTFSDLVWAILHLTEELVYRPDLEKSWQSEADRRHLQVDINRVYTALLREWLAYTRHLQADYPHLFSLAVRTNPVTGNGDATVR